MFLCQLCVIWNVASHLPLNLSSPQSWGTPHLLACLWRSAAALDFSSWTLIKLWGFCLFDWWSSKFREDCISYFLLLFAKSCYEKSEQEWKQFCQWFNYHMCTVCTFWQCYFMEGMSTQVLYICLWYFHTNLKLQFGREISLGVGLFLKTSL